MPPTRHRGSRGNDPVVYCPCISLRHRTTGSAFPFHTDGAIFRSLSLRPVILQVYQLHTVHHWASCDACYPDKQIISGTQLAWVSHTSYLACHPAWYLSLSLFVLTWPGLLTRWKQDGPYRSLTIVHRNNIWCSCQEATQDIPRKLRKDILSLIYVMLLMVTYEIAIMNEVATIAGISPTILWMLLFLVSALLTSAGAMIAAPFTPFLVKDKNNTSS